MRFGAIPSWLLFGALVANAAEPAAKPAPVGAKLVSMPKANSTPAEIAAEILKQTGLTVDVAELSSSKIPFETDSKPFWEAVEKLASATSSRIAFERGQVKFAKLAAKATAPPSSVEGPFRVVVKKVLAKRDFESDTREVEIQLEIQWEPRFPVYLIDAEPAVTTATANGIKLEADNPAGRTMPSGYTQAATIRLKNVPRSATTLDELSGVFRLTASPKKLAAEFADLTGTKPVSQTVDGVTVTLNPMKKFEKRIEFGIELEYPPSHPEFESFQQWSGSNKFKLLPPDNRSAYEPSDYGSEERGRKVRADYSFTGPNGTAFSLPDLKGWRVIYETPAPMVEQKFTFRFKDLPLP